MSFFKETVAQWISEDPEMIHPICSNRESGQGRYDILLEPKSGKPEWKRDGLYGAVIEIKKVIVKLDQEMEKIRQKGSAQELKAEGCAMIIAQKESNLMPSSHPFSIQQQKLLA